MLKRIAAIFFLALLTTPAFAQEIELLETCELGSMKLTKITQVYCAGNLTIAPNSVIETQGLGLQIVVSGGVVGDLNILSFGADQTQSMEAAEILIYVGLSMLGDLNIDNSGAFGALGNNVEISVGAFSAESEIAVNAGSYSSVTYLRATPALM